MIILDIYLTLFIILLVIMIFSGFISLIERKIMATVQNRVGPGLFLMGLFTPIFDGVKLILKFNLIIVNVDVLYLFLISTLSLFFNYFILYGIPISSILFLNINFFNFVFLAFHLMLAVLNTFLVGCFIITTCFVYIATMRSILCSIIAELGLILFFIISLNMNFYSLFNFKLLNEFNIILNSVFMLPFLLLLIFLLILYLNSLINLFEYAEAESELVAGTITEYSGLFFCLSSLIEIFHILSSSFLFLIVVMGGFYFNFKLLFILIFLFLFPKFLMIRLKLNNMFFLFYLYIFNFLIFFIVFLNIIKFLIIVLY